MLDKKSYFKININLFSKKLEPNKLSRKYDNYPGKHKTYVFKPILRNVTRAYQLVNKTQVLETEKNKLYINHLTLNSMFFQISNHIESSHLYIWDPKDSTKALWGLII